MLIWLISDQVSSKKKYSKITQSLKLISSTHHDTYHVRTHSSKFWIWLYPFQVSCGNFDSLISQTHLIIQRTSKKKKKRTLTLIITNFQLMECLLGYINQGLNLIKDNCQADVSGVERNIVEMIARKVLEYSVPDQCGSDKWSSLDGFRKCSIANEDTETCFQWCVLHTTVSTKCVLNIRGFHCQNGHVLQQNLNWPWMVAPRNRFKPVFGPDLYKG